MKKLITLVLALAMVFAIALPAMAASWGDTDPVTPTASTPFGVKVVQTMPTQTYASDGITKIYEKFPANQGVVAGSPVRFVVTYTLPKLAEVLAYLGVTGSTMPADGAIVATLKTTNIAIAAATINGIDANGATVAGATATVAADGKITVALPAPAADAQAFNFVFTGTIKETKSATIAATYGFEDEIPDDGIVKKVNNVEYTINNDAATLMGIKAGAGATLKQITFTVDDSKDNLVSATNWKLTIGTDVYTVAAKGTVFTHATNGVYENGVTGYADIKAAYDTLVGVLGFNQGDKVYFSEGNILAFFGASKATPANAEYKPYTSNLTVTDGTNVPNTGDNMSVIGFVMVGLALLATAAVVVKKVRA